MLATHEHLTESVLYSIPAIKYETGLLNYLFRMKFRKKRVIMHCCCLLCQVKEIEAIHCSVSQLH